MFKKIIVGLFLFFCFSFFTPSNIYAQQVNTDCPNRYLTLINPVRSRSLWVDKTLKPIQDQYGLIESNNFPATWLLQNDVLFDGELINEIKSFNTNQEKGLFLEVSEQLANKARVAYPPFTPWYDPKTVFLSGYSQSERRLLIDRMFKDFYQTFGYYPKSVGAWWIDSYSLQYMKEKYQVKTAMIVADQKTTDSYGVWGQWWGVPYYPSIANILTPASAKDNKQDVVVIQWAQRDLLLAYGEGPKSSNFSLQANDYISLGKDTDFFKNLVNIYLDCRNPLGQVTVGLETGMESVGSLSEYKNQLLALKEIRGLQIVKMSDFADKFAKVYPLFPENISLGDPVVWNLNTKNRTNNSLNDLVGYNPNLSFADYFVSDKSSFLDRSLLKLKIIPKTPFPWYLFLLVIFGIAAYFLKKIKLYILTILFIIVAYGLIFRSYMQYGWVIYFSIVDKNIEFIKLGLIIFSFVLMWFLDRWSSRTLFRNSLFIYLIPFIFGIDLVLESIRYTSISGRHYLGIMLDSLRMLGFSFKEPFNFSFVNQDFPSIQVVALLRFDFEKIWNSPFFTVIVFPFAHILLAAILSLLLLVAPKYIKKALIIIVILLFILQLIHIFQSDPRIVIPIS
ncbi:MAG: hypothetical protein WCV81_02030 [Microgenomates group bacterium]|jgi:hypothetical protein